LTKSQAFREGHGFKEFAVMSGEQILAVHSRQSEAQRRLQGQWCSIVLQHPFAHRRL